MRLRGKKNEGEKNGKRENVRREEREDENNGETNGHGMREGTREDLARKRVRERERAKRTARSNGNARTRTGGGKNAGVERESSAGRRHGARMRRAADKERVRKGREKGSE